MQYFMLILSNGATVEQRGRERDIKRFIPFRMSNYLQLLFFFLSFFLSLFFFFFFFFFFALFPMSRVFVFKLKLSYRNKCNRNGVVDAMNTIYLLPIFYYIRPIDEFETIRNPLSSDLAAFTSSGFIYQKRIESNFLRNDLKVVRAIFY